MLAAMGSRELSEWQAWEEVNGPLGAERADWAMAQLASLTAEVNRDTKRRSSPFRIGEFMLWKRPAPSVRWGRPSRGSVR